MVAWMTLLRNTPDFRIREVPRSGSPDSQNFTDSAKSPLIEKFYRIFFSKNGTENVNFGRAPRAHFIIFFAVVRARFMLWGDFIATFLGGLGDRV